MWRPWAAAPAAVTLVALLPARLAAQIDYRNLDDDRPTRVEDAYALERYAFEFLLPYAMSAGSGGEQWHAVVPELAYGIASGAHLGLKVPLAVSDDGSGAVAGLAGVRGFLLYNANTEGPVLPALSARADLFVPAGPLGGTVTRGELKLIATRSFGRQRLHLNGAVGIGPDDTAPVVEGAARWWYGAALDRVFIRTSLLVVGEVYARRETTASPVEVNLGLGARWQWTPTLVVDLGVSRRLKDTGPDLGITLGFTHAFALAGLMPGTTRRSSAAGEPDAHHH